MVVRSIIGGEGAYHRHPVGPLCHLGEGSAEPDTRQIGPDLSGTAADVGGNIELWIEGLDLWRSTLQEQKYDRLLFVYIPPGGGLGQVCQQAR